MKKRATALSWLRQISAQIVAIHSPKGEPLFCPTPTFLDAIASSNTYPRQRVSEWVSEWLIVSPSLLYFTILYQEEAVEENSQFQPMWLSNQPSRWMGWAKKSESEPCGSIYPLPMYILSVLHPHHERESECQKMCNVAFSFSCLLTVGKHGCWK